MKTKIIALLVCCCLGSIALAENQPEVSTNVQVGVQGDTAAAVLPAEGGNAAPLTDVSAPAAAAEPNISVVDGDIAGEQEHEAPLDAWQMYKGAAPLVKGIMILLLMLSVLTWGIAIAKFWQLCLGRRKLKQEFAQVTAVKSLTEAKEKLQHLEGANTFLTVAAEEIKLSGDNSDYKDIKERINQSFGSTINKAVRIATRGIGPLATIGSVSPFIGLFGTVWGIMNSFIGIAHTKTTNLAVVAPGIAEALLATALGLMAAIPAVVLYNIFVKQTAGYRAELGDLAEEVFLLASRDLDSHKNTKQ